MANFEKVKEEIGKGNSAALPEWPDCKTIRAAKESDNDFFYNDVDLDQAIIEDCKKECDCNIGVWVPGAGEKDSDRWIITEVNT